MRHYEHSGAVPILGLLLVLVSAAVVSLVAIVYTYSIVWIPLVYFRIVASLAFGGLIGFAGAFAGRVGKIRNTFVVSILGVFAAVPAYYVAWMFDPLARLGWAQGAVLYDPRSIFEWMQVLYENGSWSLRGGAPIKGLLLAGVWLVEAGIIFTLSGYCAVKMYEGVPYCERCQAWANSDDKVQVLSLAHVEPAALDRLAAGQLDGLKNMAQAPESEDRKLRLELATCSTCPECNVLSMQIVETVLNKKGKNETKISSLAKNLLITRDEVRLVRSVGHAPVADNFAHLREADADETPDEDRIGPA